MDKKELIKEKQKELLAINNKLNEGARPSFGKLFVGPFALGLLGFLISRLVKLRDTQSLGLMIVGYLAGLVILTIKENKRIEKEKADLIDKRLRLQKEVVDLIREVKNEDNQIF